MTIEKIKNWLRKHKKGVILAAGGAAATALGIKVFRDNYYIVPTKSDMLTIAKDSVEYVRIPEAIKQIGDADIIWSNAENFNASIANVPWDKLGEAGKALKDSYNVPNVESVGIIITVPQR